MPSTTTHGRTCSSSCLVLILTLTSAAPATAWSFKQPDSRPAEDASAPLPPEAQAIVTEFERESQKIMREAEQRVDALRDAAVLRLKPVQDRFTRDAKLEEALAVRAQIRRIDRVQPDPGVVSAQDGDIGKVRYFEVVGTPEGTVWGSDLFTTDSRLAPAAVHAGVLKPGEKGVVKVTIRPGQASYAGTTRNGVSTLPYGPWGLSYSVEPYRR